MEGGLATFVFEFKRARLHGACVVLVGTQVRGRESNYNLLAGPCYAVWQSGEWAVVSLAVRVRRVFLPGWRMHFALGLPLFWLCVMESTMTPFGRTPTLTLAPHTLTLSPISPPAHLPLRTPSRPPQQHFIHQQSKQLIFSLTAQRTPATPAPPWPSSRGRTRPPARILTRTTAMPAVPRASSALLSESLRVSLATSRC